MVNSIQKGKSFERRVAKICSKLTKVDWKRVPMSGAFSTTNKSSDKRFFGDIFTEALEYKNIVVECKKTKDPITLADLVNKKGRLFEWLEQTKKEAQGIDWILVFGWNNSKIFYITPKEKVVKIMNLHNAINIGEYWFGLFE